MHPRLALVAAILVLLPVRSFAETAPPLAPAPALNEEQQRFLSQFTPELQTRILALAPERVAALGKSSRSHRHPLDGQLTARQVMQQLLADYQAIGAALVVENGKQAAESARRLVDHPSPRGQVYPYIALEKVTEENIRQIPTMWQATFGKAQQLAAAAEKGDLQQAGALYGEIVVGCVTCHQLFRGTPGVSPRLVKSAP
jgi:hypothetical protein